MFYYILNIIKYINETMFDVFYYIDITYLLIS